MDSPVTVSFHLTINGGNSYGHNFDLEKDACFSKGGYIWSEFGEFERF